MRGITGHRFKKGELQLKVFYESGNEDFVAFDLLKHDGPGPGPPVASSTCRSVLRDVAGSRVTPYWKPQHPGPILSDGNHSAD